MKTIQILEDKDTIDPEDWCRPMMLITMSGGTSDSMSFKSMYSGGPENNVMWVKVKDVIGPVWGGKTVREFNNRAVPFEFVRGHIPVNNRLDMSGYRSCARLWEG